MLIINLLTNNMIYSYNLMTNSTDLYKIIHTTIQLVSLQIVLIYIQLLTASLITSSTDPTVHS